MQWTYQITAASRPRALMRLVQVFDQQAITIQTMKLDLLDECIRVTLTVDADNELVHRVQAKLYSQVDVKTVELHR